MHKRTNLIWAAMAVMAILPGCGQGDFHTAPVGTLEQAEGSRKMEIEVIRKGQQTRITGREQVSLLELLREAEIYISAACGGQGKCGKCAVRMLSGATEATEADRRFFDEQEISEGWRSTVSIQQKPRYFS